ncbi:cytoskeleton-associated protein 2-like [Syngnathus acus]|uniref:cytoskeleton-associated protein 2-like n=1 Tax=Syngnathus acus TaxID=161584 RepID=UPI00188611EC|nr:cytoskeleton-associated protein 2-like [Syngnathus acus]
MDQDAPINVESRKELRKKKFMEYLKNKSKYNSIPNIDECAGKKPETTKSTSALQLIRGKENQAPATSFRHEAKKVQPLGLTDNQKPPRKPFVFRNKENVLTERSRPTQSTVCKKPTLRGTYTVPTLKASTFPPKAPKVRIQPTGKVSSNLSMAKNPSTTSRPPSKPTVSSLLKTYTSRLSLGPMVKTRTGLVPALTYPRVPRSLPAAAADAKLVPSSSAVTSSKALVKKNPLHQRPVVPRELKSTLGEQPPCKSRAKSTAVPSSHARPFARLPDKTTNQPAKRTSQPQGRPTTQKSGVGGRTSQAAASRKPTVAKPKLADVAPKGKSASAAKRTEPCAIVVSQCKLESKSTKSQTVGRKMAAEQAERMKKLQEWREAKGISYKRPPMQTKPSVGRVLSRPHSSTLKAQQDAGLFVRDVDRSLSDCMKLLTEGCPAQVKEVLSRLPPVSQKFAKFWICKARLMEQEGDLDVLPMYEEAVRIVLEPVEELRMVVFDILKKKETKASEGDDAEADGTPSKGRQIENGQDPTVTPPVRVLISGEAGASSTVKYKITDTPGPPSRQQQEPGRADGHEVRFFTPVRRSIRIEGTSRCYPTSLQEHGQCVASFAELLATEEEEEARGDTLFVYRKNEALKDRMHVRLVSDY